jgi:hypothetical protein
MDSFRPHVEGLEERMAPAAHTWTGLGADNNWSTAANWAGNVAPSPGDDLVFAGTDRLTPTNDFPANTPFGTITFASGGFDLGGNAVLLDASGGGVVNAAGDNTLSLGIAFKTVQQTITTAAGTTLSVAGHLADIPDSPNPVAAWSKEGTGTLKWLSDSAPLGQARIDAGTLLVIGALRSSVYIGSGATLAGTGEVGSLHVSGGTVSPGVKPGDIGILKVDFWPCQFTNGTLAIDFRGANGNSAPYTPGTDYDQLVAGGVELLLGDLLLQVALNVDTVVGASFVPIRTSNPGIYSFYENHKINGIDSGGILLLNGQRFQMSYGMDIPNLVLTHVNTPRPVSGSVTATPAGPVVAGVSTVTLGGTVGSDPDPLDTLDSVTVLWGDGTSTPLAPATGSYSATHVYAAPGSYSVQLEIAKDGNATATTLLTAVNVAANLSPNQRFVSEVFQALLGRDADAESLSALAGALDQGFSRLQFVLSVEHSPEYYAHTVDAMYRSILGRPADPTGLQGGALFLAAGGSQDELRAILYGSPEYLQKVGGTNDDFLAIMFPDITGQPLDATTQALFKTQLAAGVSRTTLALDLLRTPAARGAQVNQFFADFLNRQPGPWELGLHAGYIQATGAPELDLAVILASDEFFNQP